MKRYMLIPKALKSPRLDATLLQDRLITNYFDDRGGDVDCFLTRGTKVQYLSSVPLLDEAKEYYLAVVLLPNGRRTIIPHSILTDPELA
jgi:hypothetical protein